MIANILNATAIIRKFIELMFEEKKQHHIITCNKARVLNLP